MKNPIWPWLTFFVILTCVPLSQADEIEDAEAALKKKDPAAAIEALTDAVIANVDDAVYARYLRATARFRTEEYAASIQDCDAIGENSDWYRKALFLKAENLIAQKQHDAVEEIYRTETDRIFAEERKEALARLLIDFADELSEPVANEDNVREENASKAVTLLDKAAELKVGAQLKEEIAYKKVLLLRDRDANLLQVACNDYLAAHDSSWRKPLGRGERADDHSPAEEAGENVWEVRMILFESTHERYGLEMRRYANRVLEDAPNAGDIEWLIAKSYQKVSRGVRAQGARQRNDDPEKLQVFLEKYPNHGRAAEAAFRRANALGVDEKISAFEDFLDRDDWPAPIVNRGVKKEPAALLNEWRETASFQIGMTRFAVNDFAGAIEQWQAYSRDFANGSYWARAQEMMVTAEFSACLVPVDEGDEEAARELFAAFMSKYPLDDRVPQLQYLLGEFPYAGAAKLINDDAPEDQWKPLCEKAIAEWATLIAKYPKTYEANLALYRTGVLQSDALEQFDLGIETLKKVESGDRVLLQGQGEVLINGAVRGNAFVGGSFQGNDVRIQARNGNSQGMAIQGGLIDATGTNGNGGTNINVNASRNSNNIRSLAEERIDILETKSLALSTDRIFRTNEPANVRIQIRNIEEIEFSRYSLDLERYFRGHHRFDTENGIESLDIDLIQPDETWTVEVDGFAEHKLHDLEVDARFAAADPGVCIIRAEAEGWQASTVVLRSNIDLITQATWREGLVFAQNSATNQPVPNARVLVTNGKELIGEGETNDQGIFRLQGQMIRDAANLNVYVDSEQGEAIKRLNIVGMTQEITGGYTKDEYATLSKKGFLYTSKEAYKPGEKVNLRGILRDVLDGSYVVPDNKNVIATLNDPNGRLAWEWELELNDFGSFELDFDLPLKAIGYFSLTAKLDEDDADIYAVRFQVRPTKARSEPDLKFVFESTSVLKGENFRGKVVATQPWGDPIVDELVRL
ncbi:MAG: MG2 domain-containing protein, partial [Verrucomicrobiota bacterium]